MVEANNIFVLMLILYLVCSTAISIDFETSEFKYIDPEFRKSLDSSPASEQSQMPIITKITDSGVSRSTKTIINEQMSTNYYQPNQFPIIVSKNSLSHTINNNYGDDTICIFVQAINNFDKTLNDINIYEIAPQDIKIINCSVPIKASSLDESIRYTRGGSRLLSGEDISDPIGLANKLKVNEHTSGLKTNFSFNDCDLSNTKCKDFLKNFNDFISKSELSNQTEYVDGIYLSKQTKSLLDLNKEKDLLKIDQQLINFLLIRDLYPSHIRKPEGYIEVIPEYNVEEDAGFIHIHLSKMRARECLQFIYHVNTSEHGSQRIDTIIDLSDKTYPRMQIPLDVEFPSPKFNVHGEYSKNKVEPDENIIIKYIIQLLNPMNTTSRYSFDAHIENNDVTNITIVPTDLSLNFSDNDYLCEMIVTMNIAEPGPYNVPSLTIGNIREYFVIGGQIEVEPLWHKYIFELTILALSFCTILGNNLREFKKRENLIDRIILALVFLFAAVISFYICDWPLNYCCIFTCGILIIIVYWWRNSL